MVWSAVLQARFDVDQRLVDETQRPAGLSETRLKGPEVTGSRAARRYRWRLVNGVPSLGMPPLAVATRITAPAGGREEADPRRWGHARIAVRRLMTP